MESWLFTALFVFLVAYVAYGAKITNSTNNVHAQTDEETIVCNQYIGTDARTSEAIKNLDEKLDQIIKLLQPSPNPSKNCLKKILFFLRSEKQFLA